MPSDPVEKQRGEWFAHVNGLFSKMVKEDRELSYQELLIESKLKYPLVSISYMREQIESLFCGPGRVKVYGDSIYAYGEKEEVKE